MPRFDQTTPPQPVPAAATPSSEPGRSRSYAGSRSAAHRPTLSLHDFRTKHKARSLQLAWLNLSRTRD